MNPFRGVIRKAEIANLRSSRTTGGAGGQTVNVSSVDQLLKAVKGDEPAVVLIRGTLVGPAKIRVGSNKSVIGAQGSCTRSPNGSCLLRSIPVPHVLRIFCCILPPFSRVSQRLEI